jgi:NitT/TauT family transport system substrate-binding protein
MSAETTGGGLTTRGKIVLTVLVLGIVGFAGWRWRDRIVPALKRSTPTAPTSGPSSTAPAATEVSDTPPELVETQRAVPQLAPPGVFQAKDNTLDVELSQYAGYAGMIAANGGLSPSEQSVFFKNHGFKVRLTISEEESWSALNSGKLAASATTADVLAVYGRQFQVVVPAQIGFSRGADGVVVSSEIKRINALKGKTLAASQFTEADFFIRYLAQEAGLAVHMLNDLGETPDAESLNLVYCEEAFKAGDLFLAEIKAGRTRLAGCVTWEPKTSEVVEGSGGKARVLATNKNLLIVADILVVNKGLASEHPEWVAGLVDGLLTGNKMVRDEPEKHLDVVAKAFGWEKQETREELAKVHLSNLPENLAFFSGAIDAAGSFGGIYQSAVYAYGAELVPDPVDAEHFVETAALRAAETSGKFADQRVSLTPIQSGGKGVVEGDPLLSKNIRFLFAENKAALDLESADNLRSLEALKELLRVSPGSTIVLRGHVDPGMAEQFRRLGGNTTVRQQALAAMQLSKERAAEVRRVLVEKYTLDIARIEIVGRGWEEPLGSDPVQNRRVEAQWFMAR